MPLSRANFAVTALRSAGVPETSVYFVSPRSIARIAASLMLRGVSKSGSPCDRLITFFPSAIIRARHRGNRDGQAGLDAVETFGGERHDGAIQVLLKPAARAADPSPSL